MNETVIPAYQGVRRPNRGRMIRGLLAVLFALLALYGFFKITDVQISGNVVYSSEEIRKASGIREGGQLLLAGLRGTERTLESRLPAVENADVRLILPGSVRILIREGTAVAAVEMAGGRVLLLSARGKVVGEGGDPGAYIRVRGLAPLKAEVGRQLELAEEDVPRLECLTELLTLLEEHGRIGEVREVDVSNLTNVRMSYADRFLVRLGGQDRFEDKLDFLDQILEKLSYGETGTIDLTRENEGHYIPR